MTNQLWGGALQNSPYELALSLHEELTAVSVFASISHRQEKGFIVFEREILVVESSSIDGFSTGSVSIWKISSLNHKVFDDSMKNDTLKMFNIQALVVYTTSD